MLREQGAGLTMAPSLAIYCGVLLLVMASGASSADKPSTPIYQMPIDTGGTELLAPAAAAPPASPPLRLSYPGAGVDVQVHALVPDERAAASRNLVPPNTTDGYWLAPFGSPGVGSSNTTYIVGHSQTDGDAPFNHLSTAAAPGGELTVVTATGSLAYRVDSVATHAKSTLSDSDIWNIVPNRLVLISCYTDDLKGRNVVVIASPAGS